MGLSLPPWYRAAQSVPALFETPLAYHVTLLSSLRTSRFCHCHMDSASFISTYDQCLLKLSYVPKLYVSLCNPYEVVCLMLDCQLILEMGFIFRSDDAESWDCDQKAVWSIYVWGMACVHDPRLWGSNGRIMDGCTPPAGSESCVQQMAALPQVGGCLCW